jgi:predicted RNase H-like HicB family nuclease
MTLQHTIHATVRRGDESGYVAEVPQLHAVTQGRTLDEVVSNLREVVTLALEGEDLSDLGLAPSPIIVVTFELQPAIA